MISAIIWFCVGVVFCFIFISAVGTDAEDRCREKSLKPLHEASHLMFQNLNTNRVSGDNTPYLKGRSAGIRIGISAVQSQIDAITQDS